MRFNPLFTGVAAALLLAGCAAETAPVIDFVGMSSGTLMTELERLSFEERFTPDQHQLVGVVSFSAVQDGTVVQATWFSPDDRRMPLGRTQILTASGARLVRFGFARAIPWDPAPYLLDIRAWPKEQPELTASGQTVFFIGMDDEEIADYREELAAWKKAEAEKQEKQLKQSVSSGSSAASGSGGKLFTF